jgi:chitin disaccharide deacetylase
MGNRAGDFIKSLLSVMTPASRLITRADDAGMSVEANEGVRESVVRGINRNVSLLAAGPAIEHAAECLRDIDACFGFHACLNSEWVTPRWAPLTGDARLCDESGMLPASKDALRQLNPDPAVVVREMAAQLARLRALRVPVRYMDEHMYFAAAIPGLRSALADFAKAEGLIYLMEIPTLPGLPKGSGPADEAERFLKRLRRAPSQLWLSITHPVVDSAEMRAIHLPGGSPGVVAAERDAERRWLTDPRLLSACRDGVVRALRYDEL